MKKLISILLLVCMTAALAAGTACADPDITSLRVWYDGTAGVFGAERLDMEKSSVVTAFDENDTIFFDYGGYTIAFIFDSDNNCTTVHASLYDEADSEPFLFTCMTIITTCGDIDERAYGALLLMYAYVRTGKDLDSIGTCGSDAFSLKTGEKDCIYAFTYLNRDKTLAH